MINSQTDKLAAIICATVAIWVKNLQIDWLSKVLKLWKLLDLIILSFRQSISKVLNKNKENNWVLGAQNYFMDQKIYVFLKEPIYWLQSLTS